MSQLRIADCGLWIVNGSSSPPFDLPLPFRNPQFAIRNGFSLALLWLALGASPAGAQNEPLRKTDLIRYLSSGTMTTTQIAQLVARSCVSFTPTARDRQGLVVLGADSVLLARIDSCLRVRATAATAATTPATPRPAPRPAPPPLPTPPPPTPPPPAVLEAVPLVTRVQAMVGGTAVIGVALKRGTAAVPGVRLVLRGSGRLAGPGGTDAEAQTDDRGLAQFRFATGAAAGTERLTVETLSGDPLGAPAEVELAIVAPPPPPGPPPPAPDRTGFVRGTGQRGRAGEPAALPVVFEVRDSAGRVIPGLAVSLAVANGRLAGAPREATTDSSGQVSVQVTYGERAGVPTTVTARVGSIERVASLFPMPAAPRQLVVLLDGNAVAGQVVLSKRRPAVLRIFCRDGFGNSVVVAGLRATSGDERLLSVTAVAADSLGGIISVTATKSGLTSLLIEGSGLRIDLSALIR